MADIFRDSTFGQILRLYFLREIAPFEDERPGFKLEQTVSPPQSDDGESEKAVSDFDDESSMGEYPRWGQSKSNNQAHSVSDVTTKSGRSNPNDVKLVTFIGPHDRDNPQNWSLKKKMFVFFQVSLLTFAVYSGSAIVTPATMVFKEKFGASEQTASLPLSMYVLGYGLGPLLFSPLSEIPELGRNLSYMSSFFIFIIVTIIGSFVDNWATFVVMRFLQGFFGGPVLATGSASLADLFALHKLPYAMAGWTIFVWAGPAGGPVASGFAISLADWRWGMWETLIIAVTLFILFFFCLPETNSEYILAQRARRIRVRYRDLSYKTQAEVDGANRDWGKIIPYHLMIPFKVSVQDPSVAFIHLYAALLYGIYYSFFESFPLVYNEIYGFSVGVGSLLYIAVLLGGLIGFSGWLIVLKTVFEPYTLKHGVANPEYRLFYGVFGSAAMPVGMFLFGYTARSSIVWVVPTIGVVIFATSAYILINSIFTYLPLGYPRYAASCFAANGLFRSILAVAAIHFSHPLFDNLGVGNGTAILGGCGALYALGFLYLYKNGAKLRSRSKFAN